MLLIITSIFQSIVIIILGIICWTNRQTLKKMFKIFSSVEEWAKLEMASQKSQDKVLKEIIKKVFGEKYVQ